MRTLAFKVIGFALIVGALLILSVVLSNYAVRKRNLFSIDSKYTSIIVGNSHSACGFDDQYIDGCLNLSSENESYLYSYLKIREIIKSNSQVKTIFLQFDNLQIDNNRINSWLWQDSKISKFLWRYEPYMSVAEYSHFLAKNPTEFLKSQQLLIQKNINILRDSNYSQAKNKTFGNNIRHKGTHADSLLKETSEVVLSSLDNCSIHELNFSFLRKIIETCAAYKVKLTLIRTPVLPKFQGLFNENKFQQLLSDSLAGIRFVDLNSIDLPSNCYYDLDHLNAAGSKILSIAFNHVLPQNAHDIEKMQSFINTTLIEKPLASWDSITYDIK